jgi:hypothetical protein
LPRKQLHAVFKSGIAIQSSAILCFDFIWKLPAKWSKMVEITPQ